jgi:hypothetical protein
MANKNLISSLESKFICKRLKIKKRTELSFNLKVNLKPHVYIVWISVDFEIS